MTNQPEKRKRAPGGGRKPLPVAQRLAKVTLRLSPAQSQQVQERGGPEYVRRLIDQDR